MPRVHHYTTPAGLDGIIRNRCIWASEYRFMNDATEFRYAVDLFAQHLTLYRTSRHLPQAEEFLDFLEQRVRALTSPPPSDPLNYKIFVASFSEEPDLLSQWRGYNNGKGFSLGINTQWLSKNAEQQGFEFLPVLYDEGVQAKAIMDRIEVLSRTYVPKADEDSWEQLNEYWQGAFQVMTALKHPAFREEREWRLVKVSTGWTRNVKTRPNNAGLIPYLTFDLTKAQSKNPMNHERNLGFERIIVGPALHARQRIAVDALLGSQGMQFAIEPSAIPYVAD